MKLIISGFGFFMIFLLTITIVMSLGRDNREEKQLTEAVEIAAYQSLQEGIENQQEPGAIFEDNIAMILARELYSVTVIESNYEKGILSVLVEKEYKNFGKIKKVAVNRTVIYERNLTV